MAIIVEAVEDVRLPNDLPRAVLHHKLARLVGTSSSLATASASFYVCLFVCFVYTRSFGTTPSVQCGKALRYPC